MKLLLFTATLLFTFSSAIAQPPPAAPPGGAPVRQYQAPSVAGLKTEDHFSSLEGRFTIALPKQISGFSGLTKEEIGYEGSGGQFTWRLKEGGAIVRYTHYYDPSISFETDKDITGFQNGFRDGFLSSPGTVLKSEKRGKLGEHDELTLLAARADGAEIHVHSIVVGRTHYALIYLPSSAAGQMLLQAAVKSFKVLSQEAVDAELQKRIDAATPKPLPQTPAVSRETTDAQDEGFKGKVHRVVVTSQNADEPAPKPSSITDFDERGNLVKRFSYNGGKPSQITQYGFIDGKRVSDSESITYESDPPRPPAPAGSVASDTKRDDRYQYSYTYKYADGKLVERQLFLNNGKPGNRSVYETRGNTREHRVYTEDGKLNQRYLDVMNDDGLDIESTYFDQTGIYGDRKYRMSYDEFDKQGNWTKRTTLKAVIKDGKETYEPAWTTYRKITYF